MAVTATLPRPDQLDPTGVAVLLVYGARLKISRDGRPGIRVTAGHHNGSVLLEAIGFDPPQGGQAASAISQAAQACRDAGLVVQLAPHRMSNWPARVVFRRPA